MLTNTKLLVIASLLIIISGFSLLWFGLQPAVQVISPASTIATDSASPLQAAPAALGIDGERARVTKVVDGDTFQINGELTVRFIGIDTPETVDPRRPVGCFGKEASNETKGLLDGKIVILQKDVSDKDKYGRLLRYVFLPLDGNRALFVDDYLVRTGFARVLTYPPDVKYSGQLKEAEKEAREAGRGLWKACR